MKSKEYSRTFTEIAPYYDSLMSFVNYRSWVSYIESIIALNDIKEKMILDLACGTGVCLELWLQKYYKVIGLDISLPMLEVCKGRLSSFYLADKYNSVLINGDMLNFILAKKMSIITCLYDSLNYLLQEADLLQCFGNVYEVLSDSGIFVFDMNTVRSLRHEWGNNTYHRQDKNIHSIWANSFDPQTNISSLKLTMNIRENGTIKTICECHQERAYSLSTISRFLSEVGFKFSMYRHLTFRPAQETDLRIMVVARK